MNLFGCIHAACNGHRDLLEAIHHGQQHVAAELRAVHIRLGGIERSLTAERNLMTNFHGELDAALTDLADKIAAVDADLSRELADFAALVSPKLTDDERAQLAGLAQKLTDFTASIDAADAPPAPPVP